MFSNIVFVPNDVLEHRAGYSNQARLFLVAVIERLVLLARAFADFSIQFSFAVAASEPRVVSIYVVRGKLHCDAITPKIIHACSESRREALLTYQPLIFDGIFSGSYVNFNTDWIHFDTAIPLLKVFGKDPQYPVFHQNCRKLVLMKRPLRAYGKGLSRFIKLEELALIHQTDTNRYYRNGERNSGLVNYLAPIAEDSQDRQINQLRRQLGQLGERVVIPVVSLVDVHREGAARIMSSHEKELERIKRQRERELLAPLRADENLAHK